MSFLISEDLDDDRIDYYFMMARKPDSERDRKELGYIDPEDQPNLTHEDIRTQ